MSDFLDRAKDLAKDLTDKAREAVSENSDKIDDGIDKAAEFVDGKTKGKYSDKIDTVQAKAHDVVSRIAAEKGDGGPSGGTPTAAGSAPTDATPPPDTTPPAAGSAPTDTTPPPADTTPPADPPAT